MAGYLVFRKSSKFASRQMETEVEDRSSHMQAWFLMNKTGMQESSSIAWTER